MNRHGNHWQPGMSIGTALRRGAVVRCPANDPARGANRRLHAIGATAERRTAYFAGARSLRPVVHPGGTARPVAPPGGTARLVAHLGGTARLVAHPGGTAHPVAHPGGTARPVAHPGGTARPVAHPGGTAVNCSTWIDQSSIHG